MTTVSSQTDVIPNVATADNSGLEEVDALTTALPTQPALVQSKASDAFPGPAVVTTSVADGLHLATSNIPGVLTAGVGDWSSPPVFAAADQGLSFVVRPSVRAVPSLRTTGLSTIAARPTKSWANVAAGNMSLWDEAVPTVNGSSASVLGANSTDMGQTSQEQVKTVFADQAKAHDAVLAGTLTAPLPSEMSWLWTRPTCVAAGIRPAVWNP